VRNVGYISPVFDFFRSIPPLVIYPLLLISIGPSDASRIGTAVFGSTTLFLLIIVQGLSQKDRLRVSFFRTRGASVLTLFKDIIFYEALPFIMTACRAASSLALIVIVVTEMLMGGQNGLGARVQQVQITSNIPDLFCTIIIIGFVGVILNKMFNWLEKRLVFWKV